MHFYDIQTIFQNLFLISFLEFLIVDSNYLCNISSPPPKYHLTEKCYRSKLGLTAKANYMSFTRCHQLGIEKKGLAINFSPSEARSDEREDQGYTCEVLKCAEAVGGLSLVNDTRFDYYSLYAKPVPDINSTCVPAIGMFFIISTTLNYTNAVRECRNLTGVLADVTSEQRTDSLAQVLAGASIDAAFVGLKSRSGSAFVGVKGDSLDCTTYRAWAPGHPRRHRNQSDCVLLTRQRTWRSVPCKKTYPTLCELVPGGPYKRGSIFGPKNQNVTGPPAGEDLY